MPRSYTSQNANSHIFQTPHCLTELPASVPDYKLTCLFASSETQQMTFSSHSWSLIEDPSLIRLIQTLFSFSTGAHPAIHMDNSLACTKRVELPRFIKGIWSLMRSPLINLNSTSDRLSGADRDTHIHSHTNERWMRDVKRQGTERRHETEAIQKHTVHLKSQRKIKTKEEKREK